MSISVCITSDNVQIISNQIVTA